MNGQRPLSANKSECLSVGADIVWRAVLSLWSKQERDVPTWSRSHPLLTEHLSLLLARRKATCSRHRAERDLKEGLKTTTSHCTHPKFKENYVIKAMKSWRNMKNKLR